MKELLLKAAGRAQQHSGADWTVAVLIQGPKGGGEGPTLTRSHKGLPPGAVDHLEPGREGAEEVHSQDRWTHSPGRKVQVPWVVGSRLPGVEGQRWVRKCVAASSPALCLQH